MAKKFKMMSKTFVLETVSNVYVPREPVVKKHGAYRYSCCVHVCDKFLTYPVDKWGRRIIPFGSSCPYVKIDTALANGHSVLCSGAFVYVNGEFSTLRKGMQRVYDVYVGARERD